jgi:hypothetical protein
MSISNVHAESSSRFCESYESEIIIRQLSNSASEKSDISVITKVFLNIIVISGISEQCDTIRTKMSCFCISISKVGFLLYHDMRIIFYELFRYQFLVYNASVIYFNCVRPFFRDGYRKYLCDSFQQVIDTLINIREEQDFPWQGQLLL